MLHLLKKLVLFLDCCYLEKKADGQILDFSIKPHCTSLKRYQVKMGLVHKSC